MRCRYRADCPDTATAIVNGRIVCAHHGALLIHIHLADRNHWTATPIGGASPEARGDEVGRRRPGLVAVVALCRVVEGTWTR